MTCTGTVQTYPTGPWRSPVGTCGFSARCSQCDGESWAPTAQMAIERFVHLPQADFAAWENELRENRRRIPIRTGPSAGTSTCPICRRTWTVTPHDDCLMPSCGCFGMDSSAANSHRPCQSCGVNHALACPKRKS